MATSPRFDPAGRAAVAAFAGQLARLDPGAAVRVRPAGDGEVELWAALPWGVLVTTTVRGGGEDATYRVAELLRDEPANPAVWRWPLPPDPGEPIEEVPAAELRRIDAAAAATLREVARSGVRGQPVGERALRDALLDHVPLFVEVGNRRVPVSQRLVQAMMRMRFMNADDELPVTVRIAGTWVGLAASRGVAWRQRESPLSIRPLR